MATESTQKRHKILLVDDDSALVKVYRELLSQLPSKPEVLTANSGARALAMLETDTFRLFICDLKMPKMDGIQVLSVVRRKFPELRTVALTAVHDEQFRSRVYAIGVDLFWHKPTNEQETKMFLDCLESLLGQEAETGFRGVQSKSLVDIVQLECLSQSSAVLRITNGPLTAKIWIQDGEVVDASADDLRGEEAFRKVLSWRAGTFETLPAEPSRPRTIFKSYNGLLLESAQAIDESRGEASPSQASAQISGQLAKVAKVEGIEFVLAMKAEAGSAPISRGLENPERVATWARQVLSEFRALGEELHTGELDQIVALGDLHHVSLARQGDTDVCAGWVPNVTMADINQRMRRVLTLWAS
jgi:CheY-like chemotaxis protein